MFYLVYVDDASKELMSPLFLRRLNHPNIMIKVMTPVAMRSRTVTTTTDERMMHSSTSERKILSIVYECVNDKQR